MKKSYSALVQPMGEINQFATNELIFSAFEE